jgi:hypothetical protein
METYFCAPFRKTKFYGVPSLANVKAGLAVGKKIKKRLWNTVVVNSVVD